MKPATRVNVRTAWLVLALMSASSVSFAAVAPSPPELTRLGAELGAELAKAASCSGEAAGGGCQSALLQEGTTSKALLVLDAQGALVGTPLPDVRDDTPITVAVRGLDPSSVARVRVDGCGEGSTDVALKTLDDACAPGAAPRDLSACWSIARLGTCAGDRRVRVELCTSVAGGAMSCTGSTTFLTVPTYGWATSVALVFPFAKTTTTRVISGLTDGADVLSITDEDQGPTAEIMLTWHPKPFAPDDDESFFRGLGQRFFLGFGVPLDFNLETTVQRFSVAVGFTVVAGLDVFVGYQLGEYSKTLPKELKLSDGDTTTLSQADVDGRLVEHWNWSGAHGFRLGFSLNWDLFNRATSEHR